MSCLNFILLLYGTAHEDTAVVIRNNIEFYEAKQIRKIPLSD